MIADVMRPDALSVTVAGSGAAAGIEWPTVRRALTFTLIVVGVLLTLWILSSLGPVVYGLPAPFFRRAAA